MAEATVTANETERHPALIRVIVIGQEADEETVDINPHAPCSELLQKGLHALYGKPGPNPDEYDLVVSGKLIESLMLKVGEVGIDDGTTVSILPKSISRGSR